MESGSLHVNNEKQKELEIKNRELVKEISSLKSEISILLSEKEDLLRIEQESIANGIVENNVPDNTNSNNSTVLKHDALIKELQKLADGNIFLKNKSQGIAVGSVQKFLNIYNNTSNKVDNDYGVGTVNGVKNFQKAQGLTVDGETGPGTFRKMISWLKTQ